MDGRPGKIRIVLGFLLVLGGILAFVGRGGDFGATDIMMGIGMLIGAFLFLTGIRAWWRG
ncbi:MAG: hypothetical protein FWC93_00515 [Defluviitaleaceae bacterium]|nr:hypothetical protein [Defluviitaleaceae bacterium]